MRDRFTSSVSIEFGQFGSGRNVSSVSEASQCLLSVGWPQLRPMHREAMAILIDVGEGRATAEDGRTAFVAAAEEAGVLRTGATEA